MVFSKRDEGFMRLAIARARCGVRAGQTPFGAVIVVGDEPVASEHNVVWKTTDITAHAEVNAIRTACRKLRTVDLSGCVLYSTCEPCPMCLSACHWARLDKVFFGAGIEDARRAGFRELMIPARTMKQLGRSPLKIAGGLLREENQELFKFWKSLGKARAY